jgi:hypothetical protein
MRQRRFWNWSARDGSKFNCGGVHCLVSRAKRPRHKAHREHNGHEEDRKNIVSFLCSFVVFFVFALFFAPAAVGRVSAGCERRWMLSHQPLM